MKKVFTVLVLFMCTYTSSFAQVGIGTTTPDSSALLDLSSTSKGLLIPRMTEPQRNQIKKPAAGLIIYQPKDSSYYYYTGKVWRPVVSGSNGWMLTGNSNNTAGNFIGTLDNQPLQFKVKNERSGLIDPLSNTTGFGYQSLAAHTNEKENTAFGAQALQSNVNGSRNTALGMQSLSKNAGGNDNTAVGAGSLLFNITGVANTATGTNAMFANTYGTGNTAAGMGTLYNNKGGSFNTAMGLYALYNNVTGVNNTAIGASSFDGNDSGSNNTAIGYKAFRNNRFGNYNTFIGAEANPIYTNLQNATAIGAKSRADCDNCLVLGSVTGQNGAVSSVRVGIGTSLPTSTFYVKANDSGFISTFENTNTGNGDGIKIKLSKIHPMWNGSWVQSPNYSAQSLQTIIDQVRSWVVDKDPFKVEDLVNLVPGSLAAGTFVSISNAITSKINTEMGLPKYIGPFSTPGQHIWNEKVLFGGGLGIPRLAIPALDIPAVEVMGSTMVMPPLVQLPTDLLPTLEMPNLETTNVTNSLTKENEFIKFVDKDDRMLGAIRAQSINDFGADYLDGVYFVNLMSSLVGIDILSGFVGGIAEFTNLIDAYNNIGVEYSSGHGDYAEWLPRENPAELITSGDIIGIKGGKITKDLTNAEQVMAVSYRPIMLGNAPTAQEEQLGNKIAFLGQIPVKVMGPVTMGDFTVAGNEIPGYGIAVNPAHITPDNLKHAVGRAWETNAADGPKMINTLIGIQNGDYLNILKRSEDKMKSVETRLEALEARMNTISNKKN